MNFDEQVKAGKEFVSATWMPSKRSSGKSSDTSGWSETRKASTRSPAR